MGRGRFTRFKCCLGKDYLIYIYIHRTEEDLLRAVCVCVCARHQEVLNYISSFGNRIPSLRNGWRRTHPETEEQNKKGGRKKEGVVWGRSTKKESESCRFTAII